MTSGERFELTIEGMGYGGEGLGRAPDGRMIFVAFVLPGERVLVEEVEKHKRWGRAKLINVLETSEDRIEPRCRHFSLCGGCHYQHTTYEQQLAIKREILVDQLERLGKLADPPVQPTVPSPDPWNYRNRLRFHLTPEGSFAFHRWDGQGLFPLEQCHLPEPPIPNLWPQLSFEALDNLEQVEVRTDSQGSPMIILHGQGAPDTHLEVESSASVVWLSDDGQLVLAGDPFSQMEVKGRTFRLSPASFFQTNSGLAGQLVDLVLEAASLTTGQLAFDLYAGVGLFSAFLAEAGAQLIAVEESASACSDFEENLHEFDEVSLYEAPVVEALAAIRAEPDVIIVDPPRAGLDRQVARQLVDYRPDRIVYVSCDPATLARDSQHLVAGGYQLARSTPIDLFPQTFHIESVNLFQLNSS